MKTDKTIKKILKVGETASVEFKTKFNDETIESLVAFANTKGGKVFIGISDDRKLIGTDLGKETVINYINEIKTKTNPSIIPESEIIEIDKKQILILTIQEYPIKPVSFKGRYYKRVNASNHLMDISEVSNLHIKTFNTSWDYYTDEEHKIDSISLEKVNKFIDLINQNRELKINDSPLEVLNKFELLKGDKITYACYLLFMKDEGFISTIELGRFQSETLIKDSKRIKTDLFTEVEESFAYIKKFINKETVLNGNLHRKEEWDYPLDAIRELIVNCIVHRDYRQSSDTVIKIFDNKIEIFNPGKLLDGITIDKILKGNYNSVIRNKKIADIFKEAGLIEKYGSGLKRVIESLQKTKKHKIKFSENEAGFKVEIIKTHLKTHLKTPLKTPLKKKGDLTELENKIFNQITNNIKITYNEIAENLGISRNTVLEYIRKLKLKKVITRKGSKRNGYWKILG